MKQPIEEIISSTYEAKNLAQAVKAARGALARGYNITAWDQFSQSYYPEAIRAKDGRLQVLVDLGWDGYRWFTVDEIEWR